jgi:uncharacterized membrane protein
MFTQNNLEENNDLILDLPLTAPAPSVTVLSGGTTFELAPGTYRLSIQIQRFQFTTPTSGDKCIVKLYNHTTSQFIGVATQSFINQAVANTDFYGNSSSETIADFTNTTIISVRIQTKTGTVGINNAVLSIYRLW